MYVCMYVCMYTSQALNTLQSRTYLPDLILLDSMMPKVTFVNHVCGQIHT